MEKKARIEAVPINVINHSSLANLNLFYSFIYLDGRPYFLRQNNLLAMFFPFLAPKLWYYPFEVSEITFERAKNKRGSVLGKGAAAIICGGAAVFFTQNLESFSFLTGWQVNFQNISNEVERVGMMFLTLFFTFCLVIIALNVFWKILGYIVFKVQGFKAISYSTIGLRKISFYNGANTRNYRAIIEIVGLRSDHMPVIELHLTELNGSAIF
jgi:hypothetical protein